MEPPGAARDRDRDRDRAVTESPLELLGTDTEIEIDIDRTNLPQQLSSAYGQQMTTAMVREGRLQTNAAVLHVLLRLHLLLLLVVVVLVRANRHFQQRLQMVPHQSAADGSYELREKQNDRQRQSSRHRD